MKTSVCFLARVNLLGRGEAQLFFLQQAIHPGCLGVAQGGVGRLVVVNEQVVAAHVVSAGEYGRSIQHHIPTLAGNNFDIGFMVGFVWGRSDLWFIGHQ